MWVGTVACLLQRILPEAEVRQDWREKLAVSLAMANRPLHLCQASNIHKFIKAHWHITVSKIQTSAKAQIKTISDMLTEVCEHIHLITEGKSTMTIQFLKLF